MTILSTVSNTSIAEGMRIVIAAQEKIGKTTLVAGAPEPLLIPLEIGYANVNIQKTAMLTHYLQVLQLMDELIYWAQCGQLPFKSILFDSATALERRIHEYVIMTDPAYTEGNPKKISMETAHGGYGKGHSLSNSMFNDFLTRCDLLAVNYGINIVMTCHVFAAKLIDPIVGEYDSWDLQLHSPKNQKTYGKRELLTQWADIIGFLYEPIYINKGEAITQGVSANKGRVLGLNRTPTYVAGNRFAVQGEIPIPIDNGWNHLADAVYKSSGRDIFNRSQ